jgi:hypothetical protein
MLRRTEAVVAIPDLRGCSLVALSVATIPPAEISQEYFKSQLLAESVNGNVALHLETGVFGLLAITVSCRCLASASV